MIFSGAQIGRSATFGRQTGVPDREMFLRQKKKKSILVSKIVLCSTVHHCKMFYLPAYGYLEVNEMCQFHSSMFWRVPYTPICAGTFKILT